MESNRIKIMLSIIFIIVFYNISYSQLFDCPAGTDPADWEPSTEWIEAHPLNGALIAVDYYTRTENGEVEIIVDDASLDIHGLNMLEGEFVDISEEDALALLKLATLADVLYGYPEGTQVSLIRKTKCTKTYHCYYQVKHDQSILCIDDGWSIDDISYFTDDDDIMYSRVPDTRACGYKCCKSIYTLTANNTSNTRLTKLSGNDYPGSECSSADEYDCKTNELIECEGYCY